MDSKFILSNQVDLSVHRKASLQKKTVQTKQQKSLIKLTQKNKQTLKESLKNIDCLRPSIHPQEQCKRILRDTLKHLEIFRYDCQENIYQNQQSIDFLFLVLEGCINVCNKHIKENKSICEGNIFGQKEYFQKSFNQYKASVQSQTCLFAKISFQNLKQVASLFKQRQLSKKIQMLRNCPLFVNLRKHYIQNIAQNSIPQKLKLGQSILKEGQKVQSLYLIIEGQIELNKNMQVKNKKRELTNIGSLPKIRTHQSNVERKNMQTVISKGEFIGDYQIWSKSQFKYKATCITEEALVLKFNCPLIESLLSQDDLLQSSPFYQLKNAYCCKRAQTFIQFKSRQKIKNIKIKPVNLSPEQKQIKSKIMARYVQKNPSLIDKLSAIQIQKIIRKRAKKIKTQQNEQGFSMMNSLVNNNSSKKRRSQSKISIIMNENYISPSKISINKDQCQKKQEKRISQRSLFKSLKNNQNFAQQKTSIRTKEIKQIMGGVQNHQVRQLSLRMERNRRNSNF